MYSQMQGLQYFVYSFNPHSLNSCIRLLESHSVLVSILMTMTMVLKRISGPASNVWLFNALKVRAVIKHRHRRNVTSHHFTSFLFTSFHLFDYFHFYYNFTSLTIFTSSTIPTSFYDFFTTTLLFF